MNKPLPTSTGSPSPKLKLSPRTILILFAVAVVYLLVRPSLSAWLGVDLPGLFPEEPVAKQEVGVPQPQESTTENRERQSPSGTGASRPIELPAESVTADQSSLPEPGAENESTTATVTKSPQPTADSPRSKPATGDSHTTSSAPAQPSVARADPPAAAPGATTTIKPSESPRTGAPITRNPPAPKPKPTPNTSAQPPPIAPKSGNGTESRLGQLTDLGRQRFRSTAGLIYVQERSEHRIDHVLRHAKDDPSRPVHGVFSGDKEAILAVIDEAWQLAQKGKPPKVQVEEEGDRSVYIIDLGRKIGFMGGQAGKRRSFPPCKHLQLVVEGDEVITAYPTIPR